MGRDNDSLADRERVYAKIAPLIMDFHSQHIDELFHAEELRKFVRERAPEIAPASPDRILRELRLGGQLHYVVINRRASLYQFTNYAYSSGTWGHSKELIRQRGNGNGRH